MWVFFENIDIGISTAFFKLTSVIGGILPIGKPLADIANDIIGLWIMKKGVSLKASGMRILEINFQ